MKLFFASLLCLVGPTLALASGTQFDENKLTCNEVVEQGQNSVLIVTVSRDSTQDLGDGKSAKYDLKASQFTSTPLTHKEKVLANSEVNCSQEDVQRNCSSSDQAVSFYLFLDELDQAGITINGVEYRLDCSASDPQ